jgi:hypothetical protein
MNGQETELLVLARIPDLNGGGSRHRGRGLVSRGRVIGQMLSFKLLAIATLLLVAMALVPRTIRKSGQAADPPPTAAGSPTPVAQAPASAPTSPPPTPAPAPQPKVAVAPPAPAATSPPPAPAPAPQPKVAIAPPTPAPAAMPTMSRWPNPDHPPSAPVATNVDPHAGANQPMAIRPPEYLRNKL